MLDVLRLRRCELRRRQVQTPRFILCFCTLTLVAPSTDLRYAEDIACHDGLAVEIVSAITNEGARGAGAEAGLNMNNSNVVVVRCREHWHSMVSGSDVCGEPLQIKQLGECKKVKKQYRIEGKHSDICED
jgi:hypothetical protein